MSIVPFWVLRNGQRQGPLAPQALQALADSGQFTSADLVWREGLNGWVPAGQCAELAALFAAPPRPVPDAASAKVAATPAAPLPGPNAAALASGQNAAAGQPTASPWFWRMRQGQRQGPYTAETIKQMVAAGELAPTDPVWREGTSDWVPARNCPELGLPAAPASASGTRRLLGGLVSASWAWCKKNAHASVTEVQLMRLRRQLRKQQAEEDRFHRDVGARFLAASLAAGGQDDLARRYHELHQGYHFAVQASLAGDKVNRAEAGRLAKELQGVYGELGRRLLTSNAPFDGREDALARRGSLAHAVAATREQIEAAERTLGMSTRDRRRGLALACLALVAGCTFLGVLGKKALFSSASRTDVLAADQDAAPAADQDGSPPARRPLQELFARFAPAVPVVEAVGSGNGSGFLVIHQGKYLVVTNRHVVESARQGMAVHFLLGTEGADRRCTVSPERTTVLNIHRDADIALIEVTAAKSEIDANNVVPVVVAPRGHHPKVGEHVFAIGHPTGGGELLTRTLSDGIVSATGRKVGKASFLQVTVPINPGNSGGPLFDDDGQVVGINTFTIRKSENREMSLEALNFALGAEFLHDLLDEPGRSSLGREEIATILNPPKEPEPAELAKAMNAKIAPFTEKGYRLMHETTGAPVRIFKMNGYDLQVFGVSCKLGASYAVAVVNEGSDDIDIAIVNPSDGTVIASDTQVNRDPLVEFQPPAAGAYTVVIKNAMNQKAVVVVAVVEK